MSKVATKGHTWPSLPTTFTSADRRAASAAHLVEELSNLQLTSLLQPRRRIALCGCRMGQCLPWLILS